MKQTILLVTYPWLCWVEINALDPFRPGEQLLLWTFGLAKLVRSVFAH